MERIRVSADREDPDILGPDWVIQVALRRMKEDLKSERGADVLEEIRREIAYRNWCEDHGKR